ncbi:MAG: class C sortase [Bilifractor sp.]|jgi:sortase A
MKRKALLLVVWLVLTAGIAGLLSPRILDQYHLAASVTKLTGYSTDVNGMSKEESAAEKEKIRKYNRKIASRQKGTPFTYQGADATDSEYDSLLARQDGVMAYIIIPKINVYLPIAHGTKDSELEYETGHMYKTSIPYGGENTHAVIAGHTGLISNRIFTDLTKLEEGDKFYIRILDEEHVYTVKDIRVLLPDDCDPYMQVVDGKDLVTLYTCTPYGINDHRLLATGERTYPDIPVKSKGETILLKNNDKLPWIRMALLIAVPTAIGSIGCWYIIGGNKKQKKKQKKE